MRWTVFLSNRSAGLVCLLLCFLLLSARGPAAAQTVPVAVLQLRERTIQLQPLEQWLDSLRQMPAPAIEVVLKFARLPDAQQRSALAAAGFTLEEYLPDNSFIALVKSPGTALKTAALPRAYIAGMKPEWKVSALPRAVGKGQNLQLVVACYPGAARDELYGRVHALGGKVLRALTEDQLYYELMLPASGVNRLAAWPGIRSVSSAGEDQPLNLESTRATKVNLAQLPVLSGGRGLLGDSIVIGVGDNTSGLNHIDLRDRIINYNPAGLSNHGMHINGIAAGAGTMNMIGQGFLPHAAIIDQLNNLVWLRTGTMIRDHNMSVTNNSYANIVNDCGYAGTYDAYAQAIEDVCLQYPNVIHVFAAGNNGTYSCSPYPASFGTVTGTYQPAKNILTVGQCDKQYVIAPSSSRGPVKDGRLKPEIVAVGTGVTSTRIGDLYLTSAGTSMSSPQVAGAAGLLQQRYKQLYNNSYPTAALLKALLMNGAGDKGNPGPDFTWGFGMLQLNRSLQLLEDTAYRSGTIAQGAQQTFTIDVAPNTALLKVLLYWHDAPVSIAAARQLVNDLDLEVVDPLGHVTLPLVLNSAPARVNDYAQPGRDSLNNAEQVVIAVPAAGAYTVRVKGHSLATATQDYVVTFDRVPVGIALTFPATGAVVAADTPQLIYWDASPGANTFSLEVKLHNDSAWHLIDNAIPAGQRHYVWRDTFGTSSEHCLMRLSRNGTGEVFTTGYYTSNNPPALAADTSQCPGYFNICWNAVPHATAYLVLRKKGFYLEPEATVTDTFYQFRGLSPDSMYYAAVQPLINGVPGYRSAAIKRKPDNGNCSGSYAAGDLWAEALQSPVSGRIHTSTQLAAGTGIDVRIRNLGSTAAANYRIAYRLNNGAWQSQVFASPIAAQSTQVIHINAGMDLSATGTYQLELAVTNLALTDNNTANDTLRRVIRHLKNDPVNIAAGFTEDFEAAGAYAVFKDSLGITPAERWDYRRSNDTGKLATFLNSDITIAGDRSVSMTALQATLLPVVNLLDGTFNIGAHSAEGTELRLEFDYKLQGASRFSDSNKVWFRGADSLAWLPVFSYDQSGAPGAVLHSGSVSLTDAVLGAGEDFSASAQLRFGQQDTTTLSLSDYGRGITLDNIRLYTVSNDLALDTLLSPAAVACDLNNAPVAVRIRNGVTATQYNVPLAYRVDHGAVYTGSIDSIAGKSSLIYTFVQGLTGLSAGTHVLKAWIAAPGDSYRLNDTLTLVLHNQPLIAAFPYLENFEQTDGSWFTDGVRSSWQYGTPNSAHVTTAASGSRAWKTNLAGSYNDNEYSFLYSPCFDISGLSRPMLSFSVVTDIEDCGAAVCDAAWMEYSVDGGATWAKLGASGQGYRWYDHATARAWTRQGDYRWHVASIPLPASAQPLRLRFVLSSDAGVSYEGLALDDVHIYDLTHPVYNGGTTGQVTQTVNGNADVVFESNNKIFAKINAAGSALGSTEVTVYSHPAPLTANNFYYLQRSFLVNAAQTPADSVVATFYVPDAEVANLVQATGCNGCARPADVYRLGIAKYDDMVAAHENDSLGDNNGGTWSYYPPDHITWAPYDSGYYARLKLPSFSEIWFATGIPPQPLPVGLLRFDLEQGRSNVLLQWTLDNSSDWKQVQLQRSSDATEFSPLFEDNRPYAQQRYTDEHPQQGANYYRLLLTAASGKRYYSQLRSAVFDAAPGIRVFPNPARDFVTVTWPASADPVYLELSNAAGQIVSAQTFAGQAMVKLPLKALPNGVYSLLVRTGNAGAHFRVVIAR